MRVLPLIAAVGLSASILSGCALPENYKEELSMKQLDASTYEIELQQPWVEQEVMVG